MRVERSMKETGDKLRKREGQTERPKETKLQTRRAAYSEKDRQKERKVKDVVEKGRASER